MRKAVSLILILLLTVPFFASCNKKESARTTYSIVAEYNDESHEITATETVCYLNKSDTSLKELKFNLFANAYRSGAKYSPIAAEYTYRAFPNGKNYGSMTITAVKVNGETTEFTIGGKDENILIVPLLSELFPDERANVEITFTVKLANVLHRLGYNDRTVNLGNWYPIVCERTTEGFYECEYYSIGDPFFSGVADYDVTFTYPEKYKTASSGEAVKTGSGGGKITVRYKAESLRDFALVMSEHFKCEEADVGGTTVKYYYINDENANAMLQRAVSALTYFSETFGKYPYKTYSVVQTFLIAAGMEYGALSMITSGTDAYESVIVHETAHQWWYGIVGNNEIETAYLDEGLSEYSVALYGGAHSDFGFTRAQFAEESAKLYKIYCSVYKAIIGKVDTSMERTLGKYGGEYEYVSLCYVKPVLMFEEALKSVGEKKFMTGLKRYYSENAFKIAGKEELYAAFERSGSDLNGLFESFISGKAIL